MNTYNYLVKGNELKCTATNERFGVMAAVSPQIKQCKLASYYPAGSSVEAATTPSRRHVRCNEGQRPSKKTPFDRRITLATTSGKTCEAVRAGRKL